MKKLKSFYISIFFLFGIGFSLNAQNPDFNHWAVYGFKVSSENESTVFNIIDDYFTNNKADGISVSLYNVMFASTDVTATHIISFDGNKEDMGQFFNPTNSDSESALFFSKLNYFVDESSFSGNGVRLARFGVKEEVMPVQEIFVIDVEEFSEYRKWLDNQRSLDEKYPKDYLSSATGRISHGGIVPGINTWIMNGFKSYESFLDKWSNDQEFNKNNPKYVKERDKLNENINYDLFDLKTKFMRGLIKQW